MSIKQIIREEIERYMLREAVDVSLLSKYINPLKSCVQNIRNIGSTNNQEVDKFIGNLTTYIFQVIFAIQRCVQANNLNEDFRPSDYGFDISPELGGNFINDFESGFYKGANWVNRHLGNNNGTNSNVGANGNPNGNMNLNNVPSVKLSVSLRNLQQYVFAYQNLSGKYQNILSPHTAVFYDTFSQLSNLNTEYQNLVNTANAQGTNP